MILAGILNADPTRDRISISEYDIKKEFREKHGPGWGTIIILAFKPMDADLGKRIQTIIERQPDYDPLPTIEKDIQKLTGLIEPPKIKIKRKKLKRIKVPPDDISLHDSLIDMVVKIGKYEGKYSEPEYKIANLGRLDVVWKRIKTGHPSYAFEIQIKGNFYQALAKLKHAFDLWNSIPVLITTQQYETQADELLSGSFHEMKRHAKIINYEKVQELFSLEEELHKIKEELDI
jgi:predicted RNA-binding protein